MNHVPSLRRLAREMLDAALRAADPAAALRRHVRRSGDALAVDDTRYDLSAVDDVLLLAVGKAAIPMAQAALALLTGHAVRGVVVTKQGHAPDGGTGLPDAVTLIEAGHPVPDEASMKAGDLICEQLARCGPRSLVLACISGGASALVVAPHSGITLRAMQGVNDGLLRSGVDIRQMNAVRSRLDRLKGGGLVRLAAAAPVVALILSDVIGDPLEVIASGLTNDPRAHNVLVGNNPQACSAAAARAGELGLMAEVVTTGMLGEARERAAEAVAALHALPCRDGETRALIYGGETTVTVRGPGKGGRNQEFALAAAIGMAGRAWDGREVLVASVGTDGTDGPTDAAGAWADPATLVRGERLGMPAALFLDRNDSYPYFAGLNDLVITGATGTNVADIAIGLVRRSG